MNPRDFVKLIGAEDGKAEYLPVAFLLSNGCGCAGYYNAGLNEDASETCVLLNAHLLDLGRDGGSGVRPTINDFNEFLEEIVADLCEPVGEQQAQPGESANPKREMYGRSVPLLAIPYSEIAVLYPVSHISVLLQRARKNESRLPTFFNLQKSEILALLRTKLW